jgi:site-specific recombinase XerD
MSKIQAPSAFFETLEAMKNPFKHPLTTIPVESHKLAHDSIEDYQLASEFLYSYRGSPDTFKTYRRELEHFLLWCWEIEKRPLNQVSRTHIEAYVEFSQQPPLTWIGNKNVSRHILKDGKKKANPEWRPYVQARGEYIMSQAALQSLFSVLSSFFNFMIQEGSISSNPVSQLRQKSKFLRKHQSGSSIRRLSPMQWDFVIDETLKMTEIEPEKHERSLFIMTALYAMYLRVSELVETPRWTPCMGHFQVDLEGNWWFKTVGKGNKEREISVSDAMLNALKRYRSSRGLTELPAPGEPTPLIHKTRGRGGITSTRQIRLIVKECFDRAIYKMEQEGFKDDAQRLRVATVHWLRHTGISEDVKHRPREHVRDDAGHGSSAITDRYIDVEKSERHATARSKLIK